MIIFTVKSVWFWTFLNWIIPIATRILVQWIDLSRNPLFRLSYSNTEYVIIYEIIGSFLIMINSVVLYWYIHYCFRRKDVSWFMIFTFPWSLGWWFFDQFLRCFPLNRNNQCSPSDILMSLGAIWNLHMSDFDDFQCTSSSPNALADFPLEQYWNWIQKSSWSGNSHSFSVTFTLKMLYQ